MTATREEVITFLRRRTGLIVHFASAPLLIGTRRPYPESLLHALSAAAPEVSASVIQPGDGFGLAAWPRNATGTVGVVLSRRSDASVIAVGASDAGSEIRPDGSRHLTASMVDIDAMEHSLIARGTGDAEAAAAYNEWGMRDYDVLGVFVAEQTENEVVLSGSDEITHVPVEETMRVFCVPPRRLFTFLPAGLAEWSVGDWTPVGHDQLYR